MIITVAAYKGGVAKSTTALHLATYFQQKADTLLVDGDLNHSSLDWSNRGSLPFKVASTLDSVELAALYEHVIIDTAAKPGADELRSISQGCDLLIIPTTPDAIALAATLKMVDDLQSFGTSYEINYQILLTVIPPNPNKVGEEVRNALKNAGLPIFKSGIRRLSVFQRAALEGVPVNAVSDPYAQIAWRCYFEAGKEILP
ncbi:MAG: ParA family protein [Cyanobacteria bacterium P01_A01_bin.84]